ncbi:MAG: hypothetical protein LBG65_06525 [Puniceicoccales bacterium]|jgi:hypothetical protein|nr:hypothetical protein [Puniceicoccales bacterium]
MEIFLAASESTSLRHVAVERDGRQGAAAQGAKEAPANPLRGAMEDRTFPVPSTHRAKRGFSRNSTPSKKDVLAGKHLLLRRSGQKRPR